MLPDAPTEPDTLSRLAQAQARLDTLEQAGVGVDDVDRPHADLAAAHWELSLLYQRLEQYELALRHHQAFYLHDVAQRNEHARARVSSLNREQRRQAGELSRQSHLLEQTVADYTAQLEATQVEMTELLASAAEFRDAPLGPHARWVGDASWAVAQAMGVPDEEARALSLAARLHDIGKLAIPDSILLKEGKLSPAEWVVMQTHTVLGERLLTRSTSPLLRLAAEVALSHHEHWDGSGYPRGLSHQAIPLVGRIVSVVDSFDALVSERPYKPAWTPEHALHYLRRSSGKQFDPQVVEVFYQLHQQGDLPSR